MNSIFKYGLIGKDLTYSLSKEIHSIVNKDYEYYPCQNENELKDLVNSKMLKGFNVTIPYKETVIKYLDHIDEISSRIGAVNTVILKDGKYIGYNTDYIGIESSLEKLGVKIKDNIFLILGSGGSSKTVKFVLEKNNAKKIYVVSRSGDINYRNVGKLAKDVTCVINTTPVGMHKLIFEDLLIDLSNFQQINYLFDLIYNPVNTSLMNAAKKNDLKTIGGLWMLICQAHAAEEIFLDKSLSLEPFEKLQQELLLKNYNLVFYGLSGAGKSAISKGVAKHFGKDLYDTDKIIEDREQMSIPSIFKVHGEKYFRDLEVKVIEELATKVNAVISLGGGAVLDSSNVEKLKLNGIFINVKRDLDKISTDNRPLYNQYTVESLYEMRKDIYQSIEDIELINNKSLAETNKLCVDKVLNFINHMR